MNKIKKNIRIAAITILCAGLIVFLISAIPNIENRTWVLSYAQKADAPYFVVAHGKDYDVSNIDDPMFKFSKSIELICEATDGKLLLTDKTNGKTYEGTYTANSSGMFGKFRVFKTSYTVVIDGVEGTANISSNYNRTLFVSIGGYYLNFTGE